MSQALVWLGVLVAVVAALVALLLWFQRELEPEGRDMDNDEWMKKGPEG